MLNLKLYATLFLALMLTACGGSSSDKDIDGPADNGGADNSLDGGSNNSDGDDDDDDTSGVDDDGNLEEDTAISIKLGAHTGVDFKEGRIFSSKLYIAATDIVDLEAYVVEPKKGNAPTSIEYAAAFSSACVEKSQNKASEFFAPALQTINNGQISATYKPVDCLQNDITEDELTLTLYNVTEEGTDYTQVVATASVTIQVEKPSLEVEYEENIAKLNIFPSIISSGGQADVKAVILANNGEPSTMEYLTSIKSSCGSATNAEFNPNPAAINNGHYSAVFKAGSCSGKQSITLTLKDKSGANIGTAKGEIEIVTAKLADLSTTVATLATGELAKISSKVVDANGDDIQGLDYAVRYSSKCSKDSLKETEAIIRGTITTEYQAKYCGTKNTDKVTISLYPVDANGDVLDLELDSKEIALAIEEPKVGYMKGGSFEPGINIKDKLQAREQATLTSVIVGASDRKITTDKFFVEYTTSGCGAEFDIATEVITNGSFSATYIPGECRTADDININIYAVDENNQPVYSEKIAAAQKDIEIENPHLGHIDSGNFVTDEIENSLVGNLSAGGDIVLSAIIADGDDASAEKLDDSRYAVSFTSKCAEDEPARAELSLSEKIVRNGSVSIVYTAKGCTGKDEVSFKLYSLDENGEIDFEHLLHEATTEINVADPELGTISFIHGEDVEQLLGISSIANVNLPLSSPLSFKVLDIDDNPIANRKVHFELSNNMGEVSLNKEEATTNEEGLVETRILSGTTHTVVAVKAYLHIDGDENNNAEANILSTYSLPFTITTGLPVQYGLQISASTYNPAAYNVNGATIEISVNAHDMWGNPVPDGTAVNFSAESGSVGSSCITEGGQCIVNWVSGGVRPGDHDSGYGFKNDQKGMTTILAYTEGEAGFNDANGNGLFDEGEGTVFYPEAFRNDNWKLDSGEHEYEAGDWFVDYDNSGDYTAAPTGYQGALCSNDTKGNGNGHCESLMHVRDQIRIVQSYDSNPDIRVYVCPAGACSEVDYDDLKILDATNGGEFYVVLQDKHENMPPAETSLAINGEGYKTRGDKGGVNNSIGELSGTPYARGLTGLPDFGMLYRVIYTPDGTPEDIELEANNNDQISRLYLNNQ